LSPEFRGSMRGMKNPYGHTEVSRRIIEKLKSVKLTEDLIMKEFCRVPQ